MPNSPMTRKYADASRKQRECGVGAGFWPSLNRRRRLSRITVDQWSCGAGLVCRDRGAPNNGVGNVRSSETVASELSDLNSLAVTIQTLGTMLEDQGRGAEAEELRQQFDNDIEVLAARFTDPQQRQFWAREFMHGGAKALSLKDDNRLGASLYFRLVTIFEPANDEAHNNLAWSMMSFAGPSPLPTARALASARAAVDLKPRNWMYWNTLGVVAFRSNDWKLAASALGKSISLNDGGGAIDFLFLAMTLWHQGKTDDAQTYFKKGALYLKNNPGDPELEKFYREAWNLIKPPSPTPETEPSQLKTNPGTTEAAQETESPASRSCSPICLRFCEQGSMAHRIVLG